MISIIERFCAANCTNHYGAKMTPILKLDRSDDSRELEFELDYQLSLSVEERFQMMFQKSREIKEMLIANGHRKAFEIIQRQ